MSSATRSDRPRRAFWYDGQPLERRRWALLRDATWLPNRHRHIPGDDGLPIFGHTFDFMRDQFGFEPARYRRFGSIFRTSVLFRRSLSVISAGSAWEILRDKDKIFSSELGWDGLIGAFFARGLMLRDFEDHRAHRRVMQEAFKASALRVYFEQTMPLVEAQVGAWTTDSEQPFYPRIKQLTLELAGVVFTGLPPGPRLREVNQAFVDVMQSIFTSLRFDLPFTAWGKGMRGRRYLASFFRELIPRKRGSEDQDLLAFLCRAEPETGERLSDEEIVDHMVFLMMAAHDTTTSALTNLVFALGAHPEWQERLRERCLAVGPELTFDKLPQLEEVSWALKETLRLYPPVNAIPRLTLAECELEGHRVPAGTVVWVLSALIHRLPEHWTDPERFDPERFSPERAEHKGHPGQFIPYSTGAHICLGMTFSILQVQAVMHALLRRYRIRLRPGYDPERLVVPFPKPVDDLPVTFEPLG